MPVSSTACSRTPAASMARTRTRSAAAPVAASDTPFQANGSGNWPAGNPAPAPSTSITACRAASNNAGCSPKRITSPSWSVPSATSANASSPRRHNARRP